MSDQSHIPLGKTTEYISQYSPELLFPIARQDNRQGLPIDKTLPFWGRDYWTAYEISWLDARGLPQVRLGTFEFDCVAPAMVESKSFKLYLNSFNQTVFNCEEIVIATLQRDLSAATGADVSVALYAIDDMTQCAVMPAIGHCIDQSDLTIDCYQPHPELLSIDSTSATDYHLVYSHLLKTNCPVTNQPDWATVWVEYIGQEIVPASLLAYIVSFRDHQDFHEHCVERIFCDIQTYCQPQQLTVYARYTRRGGLDINPFRSNFLQNKSQLLSQSLRTLRQ